jgi:hypothetical protein
MATRALEAEETSVTREYKTPLEARRKYRERYGTHHKMKRKLVEREVRAGRVVCHRCGERIHVHQQWDLDHLDGGGPRDYAGASHRRCNRQAGYRTLVRMYAEETSRVW